MLSWLSPAILYSLEELIVIEAIPVTMITLIATLQIELIRIFLKKVSVFERCGSRPQLESE